ncbi:MAG TPA: amidohydrolase family protein, partial [Acidimicrobiales bacterium]|nr:amidohydrolase family protein [Acidimicrobiales bacterium]
MLDLVVRGGEVVDGTGSLRRRADVGVVGTRIAAIGSLDAAQAARSIDASGMVVAPGFVDPHSHSDWTVHANREAQSTIRQGVTTEIVGNCGIGNAPVSVSSQDGVTARLRAHGFAEQATWRSFSAYLDVVAAEGTSQNLAF